MRLIQCSDADETNRGPSLRVVTPDGYLAGGAARDPLSSAAGRRSVDQLGLAAEVVHPIGLIQRVQRVYGPRLALAPSAVASMNDQRCAS